MLLWLTEIGETKVPLFPPSQDKREFQIIVCEIIRICLKLDAIYFHIYPQAQEQTIENLNICTWK